MVLKGEKGKVLVPSGAGETGVRAGERQRCFARMGLAGSIAA